MTPKEVARYDPYGVRRQTVETEIKELLREKKNDPAISRATIEKPVPSIVATPERAKEILGKDFLGIEAIREMENKLGTVGERVRFETDQLPPIPYTEVDLTLAKENGEMLVARADTMFDEYRNPSYVTIINFRELFKTDPRGGPGTIFYAFRNVGNNWYNGENFAVKAKKIKSGWALVKKEVLDKSGETSWTNQEKLLHDYGESLKNRGAGHYKIDRRTATETVWDIILNYVNNGERFIMCDWGKSRSALYGGYVYVGGFDSLGIIIQDSGPNTTATRNGVCPTR